MKKMLAVAVALLISFILLAITPNNTQAHFGTKDKLGGHFASKTKTYHFHDKSPLLAKVTTKQEVVNLIKKYNNNAKKYNITVNSVDWTTYTAAIYNTGIAGSTFKKLYNFVPKGTSTTNSVTKSTLTAAGTVSRVKDGDTLEVKLTSGKDKGKTVTVRMSDIDTPETKHPSKPIQKFGTKAYARTKQLLPTGTKIKLVYEAQQKDRYGRHVAFVFKGAKNINANLVKEGLARVDYTYAKTNEKYYKTLKAAETYAKKRKKNIWSIPGYVDSKFTDKAS